VSEWDDARFTAQAGAIHPHELRWHCELKWGQRGVANAHAPANWFVEFIPEFGYRLTKEPPWQRGDVDDPDWGEIAFYGYDEDD
jgi:hypothetical protein